MYLSTAEFLSTPLAQGPQVSGMLTSLPTGALDVVIQKASQKADSYCQRRLAAPPTTTLSAGVSAGATSLPITSTINFDNMSEQAVYIDTGGSQELVEIVSGGVTMIPNVGAYNLPPYPGTLTLATPLQNGHSSGAIVVGAFREVSEAGGASTSDPYTEALETQAAQLALAHLPPTRNTLTRTVFLNCAPIINISLIEHAFSFTNQFNTVDLTVESIVPTQAWVRFNVGTVIMREGILRIVYSGGYQIVPDDIKDAVVLYAALEIMRYINPFGLVGERMGKRDLRWAPFQGKSSLELEAQGLLKKYKRIV